ncbi:hypothetical protein EYF80_031405 [Liparis tanakae]|uniref:Uncharacterized protein n=1 Tax=Liparis tanakae TaxID=230148 RepID=A0A4Z2H0N2_9TELE|nr:hypothetical protein EYF80_031405 [Liparis tanakae]
MLVLKLRVDVGDVLVHAAQLEHLAHVQEEWSSVVSQLPRPSISITAAPEQRSRREKSPTYCHEVLTVPGLQLGQGSAVQQQSIGHEDPTLASDKLPPGVGQRWRKRDALCFALSAAGSGEAQPAARR